MKQFIKNFLKLGFVYGISYGVLVGQSIFLIIFLLSGNDVLEITKSDFVRQFVFSAFCGFYCIGLNSIFMIDNISLSKQLLAHFSLLTVGYLIISHFANWIPNSLLGIGSFVLTYLIAYVIIWFSFYSRIKYINKKLLSHK